MVVEVVEVVVEVVGLQDGRPGGGKSWPGVDWAGPAHDSISLSNV